MSCEVHDFINFIIRPDFHCSFFPQRTPTKENYSKRKKEINKKKQVQNMFVSLHIEFLQFHYKLNGLYQCTQILYARKMLYKASCHEPNSLPGKTILRKIKDE